MLRVAHLIATSLAFLPKLQPTDYFLNTKLLKNANERGKRDSKRKKQINMKKHIIENNAPRKNYIQSAFRITPTAMPSILNG
jgi:hypothetical protein